MVQDVLSLNWDLFVDINRPAGHEGLFDPIMIFSANSLIFLLPLLLVLLWFGLARWSPLVRRDPQADNARLIGQVTLLLAVLGTAIALGINILLSHVLFEPRPFVSYPAHVHKLIAHAADASFPSDHAAASFAIATVLVATALPLLRRQVAGNLALFVAFVGVLAAFTVAFARVYVGVHYPGDVLVGALCGIIGGLLALALRPFLLPLLAPILRLLAQVGLA